ncbi:MAG: hypothetical protein AAFP10_01290 [Pseudomonadota bacterium]
MPTQTNVAPKRPTLTQQVKTQAAQIEQLTTQLQQKEEELTSLAGQADTAQKALQDQLQQSETGWREANTECDQHKKKITSITRKLNQKEKQIEQLTTELTQKIVTAETQLTEVSGQQHKIKSDNIINLHIISGMALGLLPVPLLDIAALTGVQLNLLRSLCKHHNVAFDEQKGKAFVHALISGTTPVATVVGLSSVIKLIPAIGTIGGGIGMVVGSGTSIYAIGQVFATHFRTGGTLQNFSVEHWKSFFRNKLQEGKDQIRHRLQDVKPLARSV